MIKYQTESDKYIFCSCSITDADLLMLSAGHFLFKKIHILNGHRVCHVDHCFGHGHVGRKGMEQGTGQNQHAFFRVTLTEELKHPAAFIVKMLQPGALWELTLPLPQFVTRPDKKQPYQGPAYCHALLWWCSLLLREQKHHKSYSFKVENQSASAFKRAQSSH